jgi:hypothetical protein
MFHVNNLTPGSDNPTLPLGEQGVRRVRPRRPPPRRRAGERQHERRRHLHLRAPQCSGYMLRKLKLQTFENRRSLYRQAQGAGSRVETRRFQAMGQTGFSYLYGVPTA